MRSIQRQRFRLLEQLAVEARQRGANRHRKLAAVHRPPQFPDHRRELFRGLLQAVEQLGKRSRGQQAHVLGEAGKQAAGQKTRHCRRLVTRLFQAPRQLGQMLGNLERHPRRAPGRVQTQRVQPHRPQPLPNPRIAQILQPNPVTPGIGKRRIGRAAAGEVRIQFDHPPHVHHHHERGPPFAGRQRAGVVFALTPRPQQRCVETLGRCSRLQLLGFQHERAAPVQINEPCRLRAIAVPEEHPPLEHVAVQFRLAGRGFGHWQVQHVTQRADEQLIVGAFRTGGIAPAGQERIKQSGRWEEGGIHTGRGGSACSA